MARSESNLVKLNGTGTYPDLNMTHYPDKIDARVVGTGFNPNLKGFENRKDYNMAEHVNSLGDAVMAIQRVLGVTPYINNIGVDKATVSARITTLENIDLDPRYGGIGWNTTQTLVGHTHTGVAGSPSKVSLTGEVAGLLPKTNLNLTYNNAGGLTGSDISVSKEQSTTIDQSINDKLSLSQGGTIQKNLTVKGATMSRFYADIDASQVIPGAATLIADPSTKSGTALRVSNPGTLSSRFIMHQNSTLEYGRYVACIRLKVSDHTKNEVVLHVEAMNLMGSPATRVSKGVKVIRSTDFTASNKWQMFYFVFENSSDVINGTFSMDVRRINTTTSYDVTLDYIHICPAHPAIYDN